MSTDVVFSLDTTGSMSPCYIETRRRIKETLIRLSKDISDLRIGLILHGDYCDERNPYTTKILNFTKDSDEVETFLKNTPNTFGGDSDECYEFVLNIARTEFKWREEANKVFCLVGDANPH